MTVWRGIAAGIASCFFLLPSLVQARTSMEIVPRKVRQGDAFLIVVRGAPALENLEATAFDRKVPLSPIGAGRAAGLASVEQTCKPGTYTVTLNHPGGTETASVRLEVTRADFPVDRLTLPEEKVTLSPEDAARAEKEAAMLAELWPRLSPLRWIGRFQTPLEGKLGTVFGARRILNGKEKSPHGGIDLKAPQGTPVHAVSGGTVIFTRDLFFGGNTVVMDHGGGLFSYFMHLDDISAAEGQWVDRGGLVGHVGSTGRSTGPHLHMGMKLLGVGVNPLSILQLELPDSSLADGPR